MKPNENQPPSPPHTDFRFARDVISGIDAAYKDYVHLLGDEIDDLMGLAVSHGWKSERYEDGKLCRERIANALALWQAEVDWHEGRALDSLESEQVPSLEPAGPKSSTGSEFSQTPTSLETGGRNALNLQMALEGAEAFIGVMFGDENGDVPSTVVTPLGIPVKIGDIMREIREALQAARAASDKEQWKMKRANCPKCKGSGTRFEMRLNSCGHFPCPVCKGKGRIKLPVKARAAMVRSKENRIQGNRRRNNYGHFYSTDGA